MLRIKIIRDSAPRIAYHKESTALSEAEKRGHWLGASCATLGLAQGSPVEASDLKAVLDGFDPRTNIYLGKRRDPRRRAGWDVCLSVSKSVSIGALCGPEPLRKAIREAYDETVQSFVPALEVLACRQNGGRPPVVTGNLVIAAFTHERSRHDEPHLHTHYLVANATDDAGAWRALEPAQFFRNNLALDAAFQRELFRCLKLRQIPATLDAKGRVHLPAVPSDTCHRLSTAQATIHQAISAAPDHMRSLHTQAQAALLNDRLRPAKVSLEKATDFDRLLSAEELANMLLIHPKAPPPHTTTQPAQRKVTAAVRSRASAAPIPSPRKLFEATIEVARTNLLWPLTACIDAFVDLLRAMPARIPWKPNTRQKSAGKKGQDTSRRDSNASIDRRRRQTMSNVSSQVERRRRMLAQQRLSKERVIANQRQELARRQQQSARIKQRAQAVKARKH
jgi:conjugative relaxase-like TrwC/TraI family protein